MAKILQAVFTMGNDIVYKLDCGHSAFEDIPGSCPAPKQSWLDAQVGTEWECSECSDEELVGWCFHCQGLVTKGVSEDYAPVCDACNESVMDFAKQDADTSTRFESDPDCIEGLPVRVWYFPKNGAPS